tara:strand:+ start:211 stop:516 length:306 start_codon:yes stop_codon:yes gene_type:complete
MVRVLNLDPKDYVNTGSLLNLVLDQSERKKNLYYKIDVFSSVNFNCQRLGQKFKYKQVLDIPANALNGGSRNNPFFYKNPQFLIRFDMSKYVGDKQKLLSM